MMTSRHACVLALTLGALSIPIEARGQGGTLCTFTWHASVCADETWNASTWLESVIFKIEENQSAGRLISTPATEPTIDISLTTFTAAGDLALVGVLDVVKFVIQNPQVDITTVMTACKLSDTACAKALQTLADSVTTDQLKAAAVWWHGCVNSSDHQAKAVTALPGTLGGYLIAAQAKRGSTATISAYLTHHAEPPQPHTEKICGALQQGPMPAAGDYTNKLVGHVSLTLTPQHGGTLSNTIVGIYSPTANGTFAVSMNGYVTFTGNVNVNNCPKNPPSQHFPVRQPL